VISFLLDAQLSRQLAARLVSKGYEASHIFDHLDPQSDDRAIADLANRLNASVLSKDSDFADLATRGVLVRTVVWLRIPNLSNEALWVKVERALPSIVSAVRDGQSVVEVF
jgi:predicted nuclease of predicted toxin-antitoxin system